MSPVFPHSCPQCQNRVNPEDHFCLHCGTPNWNYMPEDFPTRAYDYTGHTGRNRGSMSIINSEAEHVYKGNVLMQEAYIAGASRQPTEEEIEAAIGEVRKFIMLPGMYLENIIRIAFNAARRKATEE